MVVREALESRRLPHSDDAVLIGMDRPDGLKAATICASPRPQRRALAVSGKSGMAADPVKASLRD